MPKWPDNPDEPVDPALAPLIEAGEGEAEGFDVAEADLIEHAEHGDQHATDPIWRDAAGYAERSRRNILRSADDTARPGGDNWRMDDCDSQTHTGSAS